MYVRMYVSYLCVKVHVYVCCYMCVGKHLVCLLLYVSRDTRVHVCFKICVGIHMCMFVSVCVWGPHLYVLIIL